MKNACTVAVLALTFLSFEADDMAAEQLDAAAPEMLADIAELARRLDNAVTAALVRRDGEKP